MLPVAPWHEETGRAGQRFDGPLQMPGPIRADQPVRRAQRRRVHRVADDRGQRLPLAVVDAQHEDLGIDRSIRIDPGYRPPIGRNLPPVDRHPAFPRPGGNPRRPQLARASPRRAGGVFRQQRVVAVERGLPWRVQFHALGGGPAWLCVTETRTACAGISRAAATASRMASLSWRETITRSRSIHAAIVAPSSTTSAVAHSQPPHRRAGREPVPPSLHAARSEAA